MKPKITILFILITAVSCASIGTFIASAKDMKIAKDVQEIMETQQLGHVQKYVLPNGMTILVRTAKQIPQVFVELLYHVGSKDEHTGEKGIAHLIEHMIFKGTKKMLSESDINFLVHKLSGTCNAFTSYDYTGYWFSFPTQHWKEALPVMADCMQHVAFKEDHLNSEMKAVIQELKMMRDNYVRNVLMDAVAAIFPDHPYHDPVIGYKQDLWNVHVSDLRKFYEKHYCPNNATLVVVGDVEPQEVFELAEQYFGKIAPKKGYKKEQFYFNQDIISKSVTLFRDVQQPIALTLFVVPGMTKKSNETLDIISWILANGRASRLHRKLVDELQLVTSIGCGTWSLFDHSLFYFIYEPKTLDDIPAVEAAINQELLEIAKHGVQQSELERAIKKAKMQYFNMLESIQDQAQEIAIGYIATGDENYAFEYLMESQEQIKHHVQNMVRDYFRPSVAHTALVAPLAEQEKPIWQTMQQMSDQEDARILSARARTSPIEAPMYAQKIKIKQAPAFNYPKAEQTTLSNGIKIFYYNNAGTPKIDLVLELKAKYFYDPEDKQGLYGFVARMLLEGTKKYTATQLADELESRGMSFNASPGGITMSMLSDDLQKGLELLMEILTNATFDEEAIEKVSCQILAEITQFWDDPKSFSGQLIRDVIYKNHPYQKNSLGTKESIESITKEDLIKFYKKYFSPHGAKIALVGDVKQYQVKDVLEKNIGNWSGPVVESIKFPALHEQKPEKIDYFINRDQVTLCFAGLSVDRKSPDYDKLVLFDQIFGGGVLGSMASRLFALREQSGLFYTITGSLTAGANEQPGMVLVKTLVSLDRLAEAEKAIEHTINNAADKVSDQEFVEARNAITNALVNNFESNASIAQSFLFLDRFGFAPDYFDKRAQQLAQVKKEDMQRAVKNILSTKKMVIFQIGRVK